MGRIVWHLAVAIAVLVLPARALAAPHDDLLPPKDPPATRKERVEAKQHVVRAVKLYGQHKYDDALAELHAAQDLDPQPDLLYAIAQVHVKLGHCTDAITYYERYVDTHPGQVPVLVSRRAIDTCKAKLAPPPPPPAPPPIAPKLEPKPAAAPAPVIVQRGTKPTWYSDRVADGLVAGGVATSVVSLLFYRAALGDLDHADTATTLATHGEHVDNAHEARAFAVGFGIAGVALITGGVIRYELHRKTTERRVGVTPTRGGAIIAISGSL